MRSGVTTDSDNQILIYGDALADVLAAVEVGLDAESASVDDDDRDDGVAAQERDRADVSCLSATSRSEASDTGDQGASVGTSTARVGVGA